MNWIGSNERMPESEGFYYTEDSHGNKSTSSFHDRHWHSETGHPVAKWLDKANEEAEAMVTMADYDKAVAEIGRLHEKLNEAEKYITNLLNGYDH